MARNNRWVALEIIAYLNNSCEGYDPPEWVLEVVREAPKHRHIIHYLLLFSSGSSAGL